MDDIILSGCFTYVSRSSHQSCSIQKPALKKFAIFTGKNLGPTLGSHFKVLGHGSHLRVVGHIFPVCLQLFLQKNFIVDIRLGSIRLLDLYTVVREIKKRSLCFMKYVDSLRLIIQK